jgi:hypothetical protein
LAVLGIGRRAEALDIAPAAMIAAASSFAFMSYPL